MLLKQNENPGEKSIRTPPKTPLTSLTNLKHAPNLNIINPLTKIIPNSPTRRIKPKHVIQTRHIVTPSNDVIFYFTDNNLKT